MPLKTVPFDGAEHLEHREGQVELLTDAASTGDPEYIRRALDIVARARGFTQLANEAGIDRDALFEAYMSEDGSSTEALIAVFQALGAEMPAGAASAAE